LTTDKVQSVYSGVNGKCCCGCAGKHFYNSKYQTQASKSRGYEVSDCEVSDKTVARVVKQFIANPGTIEIDQHVASRVVGNRLYVVYFA
jgi:hypothetical protein